MRRAESTDNEHSRAWHSLSADKAIAHWHSDRHSGLTKAQVSQQQQRFGSNTLQEASRRSWLSIAAGQFSDLMILILLAAALISGFVGEIGDTIAIVVIVLLNALIGGVQEFRAERAMAALKKMVSADARVVREGNIQDVAASELVPGDIVMLEAGMITPADLRLIEAAELQLNESALTGESVTVEKQTAPLEKTGTMLPADKTNMAFKGTPVTRGRASGVVVATGTETELGRIAALLERKEQIKTPLQQRLARFGSRLAMFVLAVCVVIFVAGLLRGEPLVLMFLTAVSLAVAAIPEALPAVVTISLAFGARKMSRHQALIRHLPSVETLGSVTVICSDKTGTLTQNRMHMEAAWLAGRLFQLSGEEAEALPEQSTHFWRALALSNDVVPANKGASGLLGDPTELALYQAAAEAGYDKEPLLEQLPRVAELPFDAQRKRMTTVHREEDGFIAFTKGAPESLLPLCSAGLTDGFDADAVLRQAESLAADGYRVLAIACRHWDELPAEDERQQLENTLEFLGLAVLIDPPREEAYAAVQECISAGITPLMITGDHPATALAIARRLGIAEEDSEAITGEELHTLSAELLSHRLDKVRVFARVSPEQKIDIVRALQGKQHYVAMTGDGVNDAPALKHADIGVAMGQKGTDVAREAADMVLLDDNFATIVTAVREGRRIFDNIRKFIKDTMSSNSGEIWTLFLAPFLGLPIPLLPIHILWINLITDGLPGLAFTQEPAEKGIMQRPPRQPNETIFAHGMWQHIIWVGLFVGG
ncbi:MAG: HAD-IC family P-type ATPase, partial [Gammaproteobacteria bacterium]|nr:HAD-IC family P-type ATPase [Gammaproteobacteria bacterium]